MKEFLAGIIFMTSIAPILDSVTAVILTKLEAIKGKYSLQVAEYNDQISKIGMTESTHVVGFTVPGEEEYYDEED